MSIYPEISNQHRRTERALKCIDRELERMHRNSMEFDLYDIHPAFIRFAYRNGWIGRLERKRFPGERRRTWTRKPLRVPLSGGRTCKIPRDFFKRSTWRCWHPSPAIFKRLYFEFWRLQVRSTSRVSRRYRALRIQNARYMREYDRAEDYRNSFRGRIGNLFHGSGVLFEEIPLDLLECAGELQRLKQAIRRNTKTKNENENST